MAESEIPVDDLPEVDPGQTAEVETAQEAPVEVESPWYSQLGDEFSGLSEDAAHERIRNSLSESQRLRQEVAGYQSLLLQQRQEQAAAQQKQQAPPQPEKPKWVAPEYNSAWLDMVERDAKTGNLVAKPGVMPDIPQKIMARAKWEEDQKRQMFDDPSSWFKNTVQDSFMEEVNKVVRAQIEPLQAAISTAMTVNNWEANNADILFQPGTKESGNPVFSPAGSFIVNRARQLMGAGMSDQTAALDQAMRDLHYQVMVQESRKPAQNGKTNQEQFLRDAAAKTRRAPSKNVPSETSNAPRPRQSFKDLAKVEFEAAGIGLNDSIA